MLNISLSLSLYIYLYLNFREGPWTPLGSFGLFRLLWHSKTLAVTAPAPLWSHLALKMAAQTPFGSHLALKIAASCSKIAFEEAARRGCLCRHRALHCLALFRSAPCMDMHGFTLVYIYIHIDLFFRRLIISQL